MIFGSMSELEVAHQTVHSDLLHSDPTEVRCPSAFSWAAIFPWLSPSWCSSARQAQFGSGVALGRAPFELLLPIDATAWAVLPASRGLAGGSRRGDRPVAKGGSGQVRS